MPRNSKGVILTALLLSVCLFMQIGVCAKASGGSDGELALAGVENALSSENAAEKADKSPENEKNTKKDFLSFFSNLSSPFDFLSSIAQGELAFIYSVLLSLAAFLICFFGYRFLRYCIALSSFGIGIFATVYAMGRMDTLSSAKGKGICILLSFLVAMLLSAIAYCLPKIGAFVFAGGSAYLILSVMKVPLALTIVLTVIAAILAAFIIKVAIVVLSSGAGGMLLGATICSFIENLPFAHFHIPIGLSIAVLGMLVQFSSKKKGKKKKQDEK